MIVQVMYRLLTFVTLHCLLASATTQERVQKSYDGDKLLAVEAADRSTWNTVIRILAYNERSQDVDVWKEPDVHSGLAHIRVPAQHLKDVLREFDRRNISHYILIDNIQKLIDGSQSDNITTHRTRRSEGSQGVLGRYARYDEILQWMDDITRDHPDVASVISIGNTFEGRDTRLLKLGVPGKNKWRIWLDGGIHAREWISPATVISVVHHLLREYKTSDEGRSFLTHIDWYIVPVVNPDGYEYSHVTERLWRKNRRPITKHCTGVDLNRNWGYHWGGYNAARDPCSNLFRGNRADSEPEVMNIINFLLPRADAFRAFVSLHNYYQIVTTRWAYDYNLMPPDHEALLAVAQQMVAAMSDTHNMFYQTGTAPQLLYPYAGGSGDWARGVANITYAYLVELRDKGKFGFLLPSSQIVPVGEEMWAGMKVVARQILTKHSNESVPEVIPDVMYVATTTTATATTTTTTTMTTTVPSTPGVKTTRYGQAARETTWKHPAETVRLTTRRFPTTRFHITRRVTTIRYTTQRGRVESTATGSLPQTKTQLGNYGPTSPLVSRGVQTSTANDIGESDQMVKTTTNSGQTSFSETTPFVTRTQQISTREKDSLVGNIHPTSLINGSCRTCCHVISIMLASICACFSTAMGRRS